MQSMNLTHLRAELVSRRQQLDSFTGPPGSPEVVRLLGEVDQALSRMDSGKYGICSTCHEAIESEWLHADPLTRFCLSCLDQEQRQALQRDLDSAAMVQSSLLPPREFEVPGYEVDYHYQPLGPVSGDYCDLISSDQGFYFFFGDVAGKGVAASLQMAQLHTLFRSLIRKRQPLGEMVADANSLFSSNNLPEAYATLVVGAIGPDGLVEICNAGHLAPQVINKRNVIPIPAKSLPFGLFPTVRFETTTVTLERGDSLFLHTDGLSEAVDETGEEYGENRLRETLRATSGQPAFTTLRHSLDSVSGYLKGQPLSDDLTAMVIRRLPADT